MKSKVNRLERRVRSKKGASILAGKAFQKAYEKIEVHGGSHTEKKWKNNPPPIKARKIYERD